MQERSAQVVNAAHRLAVIPKGFHQPLTDYGGDAQHADDRMGARVVSNWYHGNAAEDGETTRGWLLGHFIDPPDDVRSTKDVEVKWGIHPAGDKRPEWTADDQRTTLLLLVQGHFRLELTEGTVILNRQGDYAVWGPGIDHIWEAIADSVVITVRWPSVS